MKEIERVRGQRDGWVGKRNIFAGSSSLFARRRYVIGNLRFYIESSTMYHSVYFAGTVRVYKIARNIGSILFAINEHRDFFFLFSEHLAVAGND